MLLVFGGTTEGKRCAAALAEAGLPFIYSTKLPVVMPKLPGMRLRHGALTVEALTVLCHAEKIRAIVNASHPFAEVLHATVAAAATALSLPVWRFERVYPKREQAGEWVRYVPDFPAAIAQLLALGRAPLLAFTGVQTIPKLRPWWERHLTYFQILDRPDSFALARSFGVPPAQLLAHAPATAPETLAATIRRLGVQVLLTKESGESGFQSVKLAAAALAQTPLLVVERPATPTLFSPVHDETSLLDRVREGAR
ncbi:MAG TPA: precorrin-6A/cobalt-precorrin-6A reductase [Opitutaceae bacterium]|nr:precorrin-6A/cobalt-precorrin-6A reductase [Opitutaceae bacterium]HOR24323.1 precorrin-6A/cobalt-precorrin-6A reductase [Opitutaceae bacterium]HPK48650.1 precorrin-6A/cobalt-precorrin-6A reductase [Opitutaceae bacterium]